MTLYLHVFTCNSTYCSSRPIIVPTGTESYIRPVACQALVARLTILLVVVENLLEEVSKLQNYLYKESSMMMAAIALH